MKYSPRKHEHERLEGRTGGKSKEEGKKKLQPRVTVANACIEYKGYAEKMLFSFGLCHVNI